MCTTHINLQITHTSYILYFFIKNIFKYYKKLYKNLNLYINGGMIFLYIIYIVSTMTRRRDL